MKQKPVICETNLKERTGKMGRINSGEVIEKMMARAKFDKKQIQERIRQARLINNMSYQDLANKTGIPKGTLYKMEADLATNIPFLYMLSVADALCVDIKWLCGRE